MTANDSYCLIIDHLTKIYPGGVKAVDDISLKVKNGALFAFLGINGAGKSTTINIICSIIKKNSGKVFVYGNDLDDNSNKIKNDIGIVFQTSVLDEDLTVKQNLEIRTSFYSMSKAEKEENIKSIISLLELDAILNKQVKTLSGGQKRRVDIARAMVHKPRLLILDEPTTGLDPKTRLMVWSLIDKIRQSTGMSVFLTTHYLEEAEKATYCVIMNKGKIIAEGLPIELKNQYASDYILIYSKENKEFADFFINLGREISYDDDRRAYKLYIKSSDDAKNILEKYSDKIKDFEVLKGTMDDVFLNVTGNKIKHFG